jgi:ssDNA-binding Zn-finger/Zn-ribbon topoisomerase 1
MAKVVQHGDKWPFHKQAWYGKIVTCRSCKCRFQLTEESDFRQATGGEPEASARCPECGQTGNRLRWQETG